MGFSISNVPSKLDSGSRPSCGRARNDDRFSAVSKSAGAALWRSNFPRIEPPPIYRADRTRSIAHERRRLEAWDRQAPGEVMHAEKRPLTGRRSLFERGCDEIGAVRDLVHDRPSPQRIQRLAPHVRIDYQVAPRISG